MRPWLKRTLQITASVVLLIAAGFGAILYSVATPGHTNGSAVYLVSGVLFLGDSGWMKTDGKLAPAPWALSDDVAKDRASLVALGKMLEAEKAAVVAIVPAHTGTGKFEDLTAFTPRP